MSNYPINNNIMLFSVSPGYLNGAEDYFTHRIENGLDLQDNQIPDKNQTNVYSTYLFAKKAQGVLSKHAKETPDKVK